MSDISKLERQADLLFNNVEGWETNVLKRIGRRIKEIKSLSYADLQALNNSTIAKQDINAMLDELAKLTKQNAARVHQIYSDMIEEQREENRKLYDYRNKPFVPLADNRQLQAIVRAYAKTTAETMVKLSMTKAKQLGTVDINGNFIPLEKNFIQVLDKAVMSITTGTGDFNSEMRDVLKQLGGSGLRVDYGGGVTRRLDSMVRQNLLWGAKQASVEYNEMIGEELGCDGIEIDWHLFPRPSHEFMQGKQYSLHGKKKVKGVTYESADKALSALADYGCLHFKTPIILGVSEPRYSPEELKRLNEENAKPITIDGVTKSGYEWKQTMRRLETEARKTKGQMEILKSSGDNEGVKQLTGKLHAIEDKYNRIADGSGIKAQYQRMAITKGNSLKTVDNSVKSGIMKAGANSAVRNTGRRLEYNKNSDFKIEIDGYSPSVNDGLSKACRDVAELGGKDGNEHLTLVDLSTGKAEFTEIGDETSVGYEFWEYIKTNADKNYAFVHNHNTDGYFSENDMSTLLTTKNIKMFIAARIDGVVYAAEKVKDVENGWLESLYKTEIDELNRKRKEGLITALERNRMREEILVENSLRDYTKGLMEFGGE